jgi:hypothetical protein
MPAGLKRAPPYWNVSTEELGVARRRIRELETELAVYRGAAELLKVRRLLRLALPAAVGAGGAARLADRRDPRATGGSSRPGRSPNEPSSPLLSAAVRSEDGSGTAGSLGERGSPHPRARAPRTWAPSTRHHAGLASRSARRRCNPARERARRAHAHAGRQRRARGSRARCKILRGHHGGGRARARARRATLAGHLGARFRGARRRPHRLKKSLILRVREM